MNENKDDTLLNKKKKNKPWKIIVSIFASILLIAALWILYSAFLSGTKIEYDTMIFDNQYVHEIDVIINEDDWKDLKENPREKTKYKVNVIIDGEEFDDVSFSTKGNSSLQQVASNKESDRYSFKLNFKKYNKKQSYYGLDKLNLNNSISDPSYMKDYITYEIFRYLGVDAPLTSYVNLKINGEDAGLYLAIEEIGNSYLSRLGRKDTEIYKPESDSMDMADKDRGFAGRDAEDNQDEFKNKMLDFTEGDVLSDMPNMKDGFPNMPENFDEEEMKKLKEQFEKGDMKGFNKGPFGGADNSASLKYTSDNIDDYPEIFENSETDSTENDFRKVISALKNLSLGNIEKAVNITEVIDYFVCHNFVLNYDSYTGSMLHNYYLFETNGLLEMIPWDYNLAFGNFMGGGFGRENTSSKVDQTTSLVNFGIDTPLNGPDEEDRPMWSWIANSEEYLSIYHDEFKRLLTYFTSGDFEIEFDRVSEMIAPYVEKDATSFYSYEEHAMGVSNLKEFILKRVESITKQLEGTLSTKNEEQVDEDKVDASNIKTSGMGMSRGKGERDFSNFNFDKTGFRNEKVNKERPDVEKTKE